LIVFRYIGREVLGTLLGVLLVLLLIFLSNLLARYLGEAASGEIPPDAIFALLALKIPSYLLLLLPLALYFGVLLGLGRLYRDSEMIALAACGYGIGRLLRSVAVLSLLVAALVAVLAFQVAPRASEWRYGLQDRIQAASDMSGVAAGRFTESDEGRRIFYVEEVSKDRSTMHNVFVGIFGPGGGVRAGEMGVLSAATGTQQLDARTGDRFIVLGPGYRYDGRPGSPEYKIVAFDKFAVRIEEKVRAGTEHKRDATPTWELWQSDDPRDGGELQWRISMPLSALLLGVLAVPLSRTTPREGRYGRLFRAVLVYVTYLNMMGVSRTWLEDGIIAPWLGMWWLHAVVLLAVLVLLLRQAGWSPRRTRPQLP
jgi:lipopolysaccharide export system permease protein